MPFSYTTGKKKTAYTDARGLFLPLFKNCPQFLNTSKNRYLTHRWLDAPGRRHLKVSKLLVIDRCQNGFRVNDLFFCLLANDKGIRHQVVDHAGIALCVPVDGG